VLKVDRRPQVLPLGNNTTVAALALFALWPKLPPRLRAWVKRAMVFGLVLYAICSIVGLAFRSAGWRFEVTAANPPEFLSPRAYAPIDRAQLSPRCALPAWAEDQDAAAMRSSRKP
jgi:hypothetical protein